ncbi:MAG: N-acetyl sugar amidotransferase [Candidatus Aenigmarchaeota archaeon]|nr:N-acetyl sugar amidotransferase [Candidatus Aenigmarchaeota archaeon]
MIQTCSRCVFNSNVPGISFDSEGICTYCKIHDQLVVEYPAGEEGWKKLEQIAQKIKENGKNKKYDCVVGVSGGCDSSYTVYIAKKLGLRPLAVHFDNTWNSTFAVENIHNLLKKMDVDLYTYVIDNEEFNDISRAFINAAVPEIDAPTDVALATVLYMAAEEHGIKYILNGHSFRTEGMGPPGWFYFDGKYVDNVHKKFGERPMKTYPNLWLSKWLKWITIKQIKTIRPLWYIDHNKEETKEFLKNEFGWKWYGGHHMENKFTYFCHNFWLPKKFNIDLRYVELSAFIRAGQITREDALEKLQTPPPISDDLISEVKKRLKFTDEKFEEILKRHNKYPKDYGTYHPTFKRLRPFFWLLYKANLVPKTFYIKYTK